MCSSMDKDSDFLRSNGFSCVYRIIVHLRWLSKFVNSNDCWVDGVVSPLHEGYRYQFLSPVGTSPHLGFDV